MGSNKLTKKLYKFFDVLERNDNNSFIVYRCFEVLSENMFGVQSSDYIYPPLSGNQMIYFNKQFVELFIETPPDERTKVCSSIEEAIKKHKEDFELA